MKTSHSNAFSYTVKLLSYCQLLIVGEMKDWCRIKTLPPSFISKARVWYISHMKPWSADIRVCKPVLVNRYSAELCRSPENGNTLIPAAPEDMECWGLSRLPFFLGILKLAIRRVLDRKPYIFLVESVESIKTRKQEKRIIYLIVSPSQQDIMGFPYFVISTNAHLQQLCVII